MNKPFAVSDPPMYLRSRVTCDEVAGVDRGRAGALLPRTDWHGFVVYGVTVALGAVTAFLILSPTVKWLQHAVEYLGRNY